MPIPTQITVLEPWVALSESPSDRKTATVFLEQINRELPAGHVLKGANLDPVARRLDNDDVLFEVVGGDKPLAVVHLTYGKENVRLPYPNTKLFDSWDDWATKSMRPSHEDWASG